MELTSINDDNDRLTSPINDDYRESKGLNINIEGRQLKRKKCLIIGISLTILTLIIAAVVIFFIIRGGNEEKDSEKDNESDEESIDDKEIIGEIICQFNIKNENQDTKILGDEFNNNYKLDIYIDEEKIKYSKIYKFNNTGYHKIEFKFYDNINMDYMFKNIKDLKNIEIFSIKICKIL